MEQYPLKSKPENTSFRERSPIFFARQDAWGICLANRAAHRLKRRPKFGFAPRGCMFRGNHPAKVDEKGRLKLPSAFKQLVDAASVTQFYVTSVDGESAQVWPLPEWEQREAQLAESSEMEEAVQKYLSLTSYYGQQVELDAQARILLPQILRSAAGLDDEEAAVIGMGTYVEVHNRKRFEQTVLTNKLTAEDRMKLAEITRRKS